MIEGKESARAFVVVRWMAEQMAEGMMLNKPGHSASCCLTVKEDRR